MTAIHLTQISSRIVPSGATNFYDTSEVFIYYYKNKILYDLPLIKFSSISDSSFNGQLERRLVLQQPDSIYGFVFDKGIISTKRRAHTDSILNNEWFMKQSLYQNLQGASVLRLLDTQTNNDSGLVRETYDIISKLDSNYKGAGILTFSRKSPSFDLKFTREYQEKKHLQLTRAEITSRAQYYAPLKDTISAFTYIVNIEAIPLAQTKEATIKKYFF